MNSWAARARANIYLQDAAPWAILNADPEQAAANIGFVLRLVHLSARLAWSIVPKLAETVLVLFGKGEYVPPWPKQTEDFLLAPIDAKCVERLKEPLQPSRRFAVV